MCSLFSKFTLICGFTWAIILASSISAQESPFIGGNLNDEMNSLVFTAEHTVFQTYTNPKNINSLVIEKLSDNVFWLGSSAGLIRLDVISGKQEIFTDQLPGAATRVVCQSADNAIWIGTEGGLVRFNYDHREWTIFNVGNSELPNNRVNSILQTSDGAIWIGAGASYGDGGLSRFDYGNNDWTLFHITNSLLPQLNVKAMIHASDGALWFGAQSNAIRAGGITLAAIYYHSSVVRFDYASSQWAVYDLPEKSDRAATLKLVT